MHGVSRFQLGTGGIRGVTNSMSRYRVICASSEGGIAQTRGPRKHQIGAGPSPLRMCCKLFCVQYDYFASGQFDRAVAAPMLKLAAHRLSGGADIIRKFFLRNVDFGSEIVGKRQQPAADLAW